jgi:hypothetical protein
MQLACDRLPGWSVVGHAAVLSFHHGSECPGDRGIRGLECNRQHDSKPALAKSLQTVENEVCEVMRLPRRTNQKPGENLTP